ncbi:hypothetical protein [Fusibacter bizertensis]
MKNNPINWTLWLNDQNGRIIYRPNDQIEKMEQDEANLIKWTK